MTRAFIASAMLLASVQLMAQNPPGTEITRRNSWLKLGLLAGVPVGNTSNVSNFSMGIDLKGQVMETNHFGIGLATGYSHYFSRNNFKSFGTVPLGVFIRVYPASEGIFLGLDGGYSWVTGISNASGGAYLRPQLGYHNYDWNIFAYYNSLIRNNRNGGSIQQAGIGATYNIRFSR